MKTRFLIPTFAAIFAFLTFSLVHAQTFEVDSDRLDQDIDRVTLHVDDPKLCQKICSETDECKAWTYTPAGYNLYETPQCWLKGGVPRAFDRKGAVSGTFPDRIQPDDDVEEQPSNQAASDTLAMCNSKHNSGPQVAQCIQKEAAEQLNIDVCDAIRGTPRNDCRVIAAYRAQSLCENLGSSQDRYFCRVAAMTEFPAPGACDSDLMTSSQMECYITTTHISGDRARFMAKIRDMHPTERDMWVAGLATIDLDYDLLELIEGNRTHDQALTLISTNRIGAGKYVEPGVCSALVGGYPDADDGLSSTDVIGLCLQSIAIARVFDDWADGKSIEEILELQEQMEQYLEAGIEDLAYFPMGLGAQVRTEMEKARVPLQAASITQSGSTAPAITPTQPVEPSGPVVLQPTTDGDDCPFGLCPD
ncbi:PAN domain-containing protein [Pontixanthobacter sp. CEM42]|uniref:PAN domain-containing protein n=1 Tax=Pontixanthobacter sp. CEM42 TaxID=2792077 RepID=UPI001ADEDA33|nr:PAN domain-containing protein [Pontixanthobacter sp. CEM42]